MNHLFPFDQHVLYEYDCFLIGKDGNSDDYYFRTKSAAEKERYALSLIKHVIEDYLRWTPTMARDNLSLAVLKEWNLDRMAERISFPKDLEQSLDMFYIVHKLWPQAVPMNAQDIYIQIYRRVLFPIDGHKAKYPKGYFSGKAGMNKACACLKYAIENFLHFSSVDEMYAFFSNKKKVSAFFKKYKLTLPAKTFFNSPVEYLEYTLHESQSDIFLAQFYNFQYQLENM